MSNNAKKTRNTHKPPTKHVFRLFKNFLKIWFSAQKSGSRLRCQTMLKNTLKHPENTNKTCFEAFWEILENPVLGSKIWFSAQISNYAKIPWNTQKTPTKHVLRLFKIFVKIRFSAQKSGSRPRCRTMLKILWNTQKTPTKHALRHFKKFLKIRFLAEKSGSRLIIRIKLKYHETLRKHQLNMFWGFWEILENPVLGWKIRFSAQKCGSQHRFLTMLKYLEILRKHQLNMFWGLLRNLWKSGSRIAHKEKKYFHPQKHIAHSIKISRGF